MNTKIKFCTSSLLALAALSFLATTTVHAQTIGASNLFTNATVSYSSGPSNEGVANGFNDGTGASFIFSDFSLGDQDVVFSGFNSAIDTINIYSITDRRSNNVTVYYDNTGYTGFDTTQYAGSLTETALNYNNDAGITYPGNSAFEISYASLTGLALPADTTSVLLQFTRDSGMNGSRISEVQAFAPAAAPEPSTYALMLLGLGSMFVYVRMRGTKLS